MNSSSGGNYYSCLDPDPGIAGNSPKRKSSKKINIDSNIAFPSLAKTPISFKTCPKFVVIKSTILEKNLFSIKGIRWRVIRKIRKNNLYKRRTSASSYKI